MKNLLEKIDLDCTKLIHAFQLFVYIDLVAVIHLGY